MKKRTLSAILVCPMLIQSFAACSENEVNPADESTAPPEISVPGAEGSDENIAEETLPEEAQLQPNLPDITFDDRTFTFLTSGSNDTNGADWETYDIWVESMTGEVINDSVFERNLYLEDTYKVKIAEYKTPGDITVIDNDATWVLMFNKAMLENYQMPNLYELVREDQWDFDTFHDLAVQASSDLNGDGVLTSKEDQFDFITSGDSAYGLMYAYGEKLVVKNEISALAALTDIERLSGVVERATAIMSDKNLTFLTGYEGTDAIDIQRMFEGGRGLFFGEVMQCIIRMRASETDFGLLPWPKYDEIQQGYYNWIHTSAGRGVVVPSSQDDLEITGVIIEAMAAKSMYTVTPAYYDTSLTYKFMRDEESSEMLDIILQSRIYDLSKIYNFASVSTSLASSINNGTANFASTWKAQSKVFGKLMEKTVNNFAKLEEERG